MAVHCFPDAGIRRFVELGVRSVEHGTLITEDTARLVTQRVAFIVPTLAAITGVLNAPGTSEDARSELRWLEERSLTALETMKRLNVKVGFGTDPIGENHPLQGSEFTLRRRALEPLDILRSACAVNAELLGMQGRLGYIAPGAHADLLVVDGDPLEEVELLSANGRHPSVIVRAGAFHKRRL